ncbi:hypothetical protein CRM22_009738 [Opisthorchis felineus]|uniref:RING-type domain-containing protein n=1 Tax=Opisthorchis felineus TaxID=147828 RepID=A0A4S2L6D8_OPIFE|nr:hypothetical protein CRM22_009738 [Opisthorchis felineus]
MPTASMPWTYDTNSQIPRSSTPGSSFLNNNPQETGQSIAYTSAPIVLTGLGSTVCPQMTTGSPMFVNSPFSSIATLPGRPRLLTERPLRQIRHSFFNSRLEADRVFSAEQSTSENQSWCITDSRPDLPWTHPTIPKRRRTSTGSVGFMDCTYLPAAHEVTGAVNRPDTVVHMQSPVSAVLANTVSAVRLVRGGWHCEVPPTTVCLQSTAQQQSCSPSLTGASAVPVQSTRDRGLRNFEDVRNVRYGYQSRLLNRVNSLHHQPHQRKRLFCRAYRDHYPKMAYSASLVRSRHQHPYYSSKSGNTSRQGSSSDAIVITVNEDSVPPVLTHSSSDGHENEESLLSFGNSVNLNSGVQQRPDNFGAARPPSSTQTCTAPSSPTSMGARTPLCVRCPSQSSSAVYRFHPSITNQLPLPNPADNLHGAPMSNLVAACRTANAQQCMTTSYNELGNVGRNPPDSLGFAVSRPSNRPGPQADEATVVAAAAVASAAAHAVAAAAQAVSAAVQQRHCSDVTYPAAPIQPVPRSSVERTFMNQWTSPQLSFTAATPSQDCCGLHSVLNAHSSVQHTTTIPSALVANFAIEQGSASLAIQPLGVPLIGAQPIASVSDLNCPIQNTTEFGTSNNISLLGVRSGSQSDRLWLTSEAPNGVHCASQPASFPSVTIATQAAHAVAAAAAAQVAAAVATSAPVSFLSGNLTTDVQINSMISHAPLIRSQLAPANLMTTPHPVRFSSSLLAIPSTQSAEADFFTVSTDVASVAAAAAVAAAASRAPTLANTASAFQLATASDGTARFVNVTQPIGPDRSFAQSLLIPQISMAPQITSVSVLPVHSAPPIVATRTALSTTRDIQTLFQFLRLINQRQDPYSLPYYPSAMTATAGESNASVVVSASMGGANGSRVASAVTPPLVPHHSTGAQHATVATVVGPTSWQQPTRSPGFILSRPAAPIPNEASNVQPTGSAAVALAAVAMAAAAALQQQTHRHIPANVMSMLSAASAAPTPSIPVPILHAHLYYPTTVAAVRSVPVTQVPPCHHSHHGSFAAAHQHATYHRQTVPSPFTASLSPAVPPSPYPTSLLPFFVTVPASPTRNSTDVADLSSTLIAQLTPNHQTAPPSAPMLPPDPSSAATAAAAAVAAAAAAAAASVDTLYQLAVQLESSGRRGLTKEELDTLPVRSYGQIHEAPTQLENTKDCVAETEDRCMICLDDYEPKDLLRAMRCRHEFHAKCVDKWLKTKRTCPLCRADAFDGTQRKEELF